MYSEEEFDDNYDDQNNFNYADETLVEDAQSFSYDDIDQEDNRHQQIIQTPKSKGNDFEETNKENENTEIGIEEIGVNSDDESSSDSSSASIIISTKNSALRQRDDESDKSASPITTNNDFTTPKKGPLQAVKTPELIADWDKSSYSMFNAEEDEANIIDDDESQLLDTQPTDLESLWEELGLSQTEIEAEEQKLADRIERVKRDAIKEAIDTKNHLISQIEEIKTTHIKQLAALGNNESLINEVKSKGNEGTLIERYTEVKSLFDGFKPTFEEREEEFLVLKENIDELFDKIGYEEEDRGEFNEIGETDLTKERLQRFESRIEELKAEVKSRENILSQYKTDIQDVMKQIESKVSPKIQEIFDNNDVSHKSFEILQEYLEDVTSIRESRIKKLYELAVEITHEWELLRTPKEERNKFLEKKKLLTEESISECEKEIVRLRSLRNEKLPELINDLQNELIYIYETFHYPETEIQKKIDEVFSLVTNPNDNIQIFNVFEKAVYDNRKLLQISQPLIDLAKQRNDIITEYENCIKEEEQKMKSMKNKNEKVQNDPKTEKIKRRYKCVLPRIEKKLLISAMEYKKKMNEDFVYDGMKVVDMLKHVKLSQAEVMKTKGEIRRKTQTGNKLLQPEKTRRKSHS
ncbi:hypothetical protein GPJ56_010155 [Histomonas meleagridis]|uniref:uncharacterized protein n=1 Tax=Histomonas meleagridis TaxID=135588 RepID=UPI00355A0915|nr:hypothetical protein GPJ56_010155 [Histomonas meleagridis]KAH0804691.1 hypothetical protein GO595_002385 [Histomonas meleagridis]